VRTWVRGREVYRDGQIDDSVRGAEAQYDHARGGYWATSG
jgi:dihydroorotase